MTPGGTVTAAAEVAFYETMDVVEPVEGWLTRDQARRLWERVRAVPARGVVVEIGSYRGRSTILLGRGAPVGASVVAIDPHAGSDRGPQEIRGTWEEGEADHRAFRANLERGGVADRVRHVRLFSQEALGDVQGQVDLLYVDGAHRFGPARDDIERWGARVRPGGAMLVHDGFSAIGVTLATLRLLVPGRRFRYAGRTGSLVEYERSDLGGRERLRNALRQLAELPWFARNLVVKVALVTHLTPLARLVGHRSRDWPY